VPTPELLLRRLDDLGAVLERHSDAIALIGLGSVGVDLGRLDEHSDLDFFVIVEDDAKQRYLDSLDWLVELAPIGFSFRNTVDGHKVLFEDGVFAECAVFTLSELGAVSFPPGRLVWARAHAPAGLEAGSVPGRSSLDTPETHVNEALTNLYVGLHRDARGERLAAMRLIQVHAVDRLLTFVELSGGAEPQDAFAVDRGAERRVDLPYASFMPGYERNADAALAILAWLEEHAEVDGAMAAAIRARTARPV
jgi:hypothetical protein